MIREVFMTPQKEHIYRLLVEAKTYEEIAEELSISRETVKSHSRQIYRMYNVKNRSELLARIIKELNPP